ncbi:MAG: PAS domain S-box protein [Candidatus Hydrogenedentes bacterium]|nr:PAS domain S-box protein [Candidatus Hydrogenedentota bacterium]
MEELSGDAGLVARSQAILSTGVDGVLTIDSAGIIGSVNPALRDLFGYEADELLGQNVSLLMEDAIARHHDGYIAAYLHTGERHVLGTGREVMGKKKDGTLFPFYLSVAEFVLEGRVYFTGFIHDLSMLRAAESKALQLQTAVDASEDGVLVLDGAQRVLYCNRASEAFTGASAGELTGAAVDWDFLSSAIQTSLTDALEAGRSWIGRHILRRAGHVPRQMEIRLVPSPSPEQSGARFIVMFHDISQQSQLESQLHAIRKLEVMGAYAGGIAHEFNNILQVIRGFASIAASDVEEESPVGQCLREIRKAGDRLAHLADHIDSLNPGKNRVWPPAPLRDLVAEDIRLLRNALPVGARIHLESEGAIPPITTAASLLHQLMMHLVAYAAHRLPEKGASVRIRLTPFLPGPAWRQLHQDAICSHLVRIQFGFNCEMAEEETSSHLHDPLHTARHATPASHSLSMAAAVVAALHGVIEVASGADRSTMVAVYFPVSPVAELPEKRSKPKDCPRLGVIMFVDDEENLAEMVRMTLGGAGHEVEVYYDVNRALTAFGREPSRYALIISDLVMPGFGGDHLAREVGRSPVSVPVILSSGHFSRLQEVYRDVKTIVDTLPKPFDGHRLLQVAAEYVSLPPGARKANRPG